jgi:hypothetical protein
MDDIPVEFFEQPLASEPQRVEDGVLGLVCVVDLLHQYLGVAVKLDVLTLQADGG